MIIDLKQLFNITGERREFSFEILPDELSDIYGYEFVSPVNVNGVIFNKTGVVYLEYSVDFTLGCVCGRCLDEFTRDSHFEFSWIVVYKESESEPDISCCDYITADEESIDLKRIAVSDLLTECPTKTLCSDKCKGLCIFCGHNLNESECGHDYTKNNEQ